MKCKAGSNEHRTVGVRCSTVRAVRTLVQGLSSSKLSFVKYGISYTVYDIRQKNDDWLLLTIKVFAKRVFFLSAAKRIFNLVASGENIFEPTSKTQKTWLRIVQKYNTENTNATPCTYSGKLQFANTHCGNVFIIGSRKFSRIFGEKKTVF